MISVMTLVLVMIMTFQIVQSAAAAKGIETIASNHTRNSFDSHLRRSLKKDKTNGDVHKRWREMNATAHDVLAESPW